MRLVAAAGRARGDVARAERADLGAHRHAQRALARAGDDVDDAADGVGAVEAAHGPADHLDALDVLGRQVGEVELAVGDVVGLDAVDQHQRVVALGTADAHLREVADAAAAADGDARQAAQGVGGIAHLLGAQLLAGHHRDGVADGVGRDAADAVAGRRTVGGCRRRRCGAAGRRARGARTRRGERRSLHDDGRQRRRLLRERRGMEQRQGAEPGGSRRGPRGRVAPSQC